MSRHTLISSSRLAALAAVLVSGFAAPAAAQLDPLLFLKTTRPHVIIAVDMSQRMQRDADETYYDPRDYRRLGNPWEVTLGISAANTTTFYRRKFRDMVPSGGSGTQFVSTTIDVVTDQSSSWSTYFARTRLGVARAGIKKAVEQNRNVARYGLIKMRQASPTWSAAFTGAAGVSGRSDVSDVAQQTPSDDAVGRWGVNIPDTTGSNSGVAATALPLVASDAAGANSTIISFMDHTPVTAFTSLIPSGRSTAADTDAPVDNLLDDVRTEAGRLIQADTTCCNTIVVLIVGGGEGSLSNEDLAAKASTFTNVRNGRRVPIYVVALAPQDSEVPSLQDVATNSGGRFFRITKAMIDAVPAGQPVPQVVEAINQATQHAFIPITKFNTGATAAPPTVTSEEFQVTSPITGTVNLEGASDIAGSTLPNTTVTTLAGATIPQRQNVMVTSGFTLPGFTAALRAFRVYRPLPDASTSTGYKFVQDGTPLWVASAPPSIDRRLYTVLPDGTMLPFTTSNAAALAPYLRSDDPARLIAHIRNMPLGAVVSSTPAIMDPPSIDPPPDADYPAYREANKNRRSMVWVGTNHGMLHGIDARLGVEVWGFIPFNLLPKLRMLEMGQPVGDFNYFVDSSAKIADVKVGGSWRTYLFVGQGAGGTFYNTFDVTLDNMAASVPPDSDSAFHVLNYFNHHDVVRMVWSFPRNSAFDPSIDAYGDLGAGATAVEKSVGETWSDPAIGQVQSGASPWVMFVGSGFFKASWQSRPFRGGARAGTTFYLLNIQTGAVLDSIDVGSDGIAESIDNCADATVNRCDRLKNALQMDPVATGPVDSRYVDKAYIGDLDGRVWRLSFGLDASLAPRILAAPTRLYSATEAHPLFASMATVTVGPTANYMFLGTGSDLLPSNGVNFSYKLLVLQDTGTATATRSAEILLERVDGAAGDEKITAFPAVAGDIVFFTTTTFTPGAVCTAPYTANLYGFTFVGGPAYDTNGDGRLTARSDSTKITSVSNARATAPFIVDQHLSFSAGGEVQMFGDPQDFNNGVGQVAVRILSWREIK